jgi:polysaccharide biosynthesis protein PslH
VKILYVAPASPWPLHFGGSMRVATVLAALEAAGEVELAVLADEPGEEARDWLARRNATLWAAAPEKVLARAKRIAAGAATGRSIPAARLFTGKVLAQLRDAAARADVVVLGDTYSAETIGALAGFACRVVIDTHNVESQLWRDIAAVSTSLAERAGYRLLARNSAALERRTFPRAHSVWAASTEDAAWYRSELGLASVHVVPNVLGELPAPARPADEAGSTIVMTGLFAYPPNEDAALLLIAASRELASRGIVHRLCLVGRSPTGRMIAAARGASGIEITGAVEDVGPWLELATLFAAPLRAGSGTKFKVLQAMAAGRAVVTTAAGARGLALVHDRHAWVCEAGDIASALEMLLSDAERRHRLALAARRHLECHFLQRAADDAVRRALESL